MSKIITTIVAVCIAIYTAVMGYSLGVITETDASVTSSFLRTIVHSPATFAYAPKTWKVWKDGTVSADGKTYNGYFVSYPRDFDVHSGTDASGNLMGTPRVKISFPEDAFMTPKTNYGEAYMTVSVASDQPSIKNCYANPDQSGSSLVKVETINGITYHVGNLVEPAAGNIYDSEVYRAIEGLQCYEVVLTVHTGNIQNYTPGTVQEFDKKQAFLVLEKMLGTLTFTDKNPNL